MTHFQTADKSTAANPEWLLTLSGIFSFARMQIRFAANTTDYYLTGSCFGGKAAAYLFLLGGRNAYMPANKT